MDEDGCHVWWFHDCMTYLGHGDGTTLTPCRAETWLPIKDTGWQVQQIEPLTVTPSILCGRCQTHGFITNGQWVGVP
jgi:hypothetical protein